MELNSFMNMPKNYGNASNVEIAQAIASSGANKITLDISEIPEEEQKIYLLKSVILTHLN